MMYEVIEHREYPGVFHVELIGEDGEIYVAAFSGPKAQIRANEYLEWKNRSSSN